jgi:hypothetical protein
MGRLQCTAQWHSNPMAWAHSTGAALSGPRRPSTHGQRACSFHAARAMRVRGGDTDSEDWRPAARCWLDDNVTRENVVRPSLALESGVDDDLACRSDADSGTSAPMSSAHEKEGKW